MLDYDGIRALAKEIKAPTRDLLTLADVNDPFYVDVVFRKAAALWVVGLRHRINFGYRFHIGIVRGTVVYMRGRPHDGIYVTERLTTVERRVPEALGGAE